MNLLTWNMKPNICHNASKSIPYGVVGYNPFPSKFIYLFLSSQNLPNHCVPFMQMLSLESLQWIGVHWGDFIMFRFIVWKLLNIEQKNQIKFKIKLTF
jgi:hypothetical protein